jgi:hypothetical protein
MNNPFRFFLNGWIQMVNAFYLIFSNLDVRSKEKDEIKDMETHEGRYLRN